MPKPNATFSLLLGLALGGGGGLLAAATRFLRAGIPTDGHPVRVVTWTYLLVPGTGDVTIHLISYLLLALLIGGLARALAQAALQLYHTRRFVARCFASGRARSARLARVCRRIGLIERIDLVVAPRPLAFCHGLWRPRVCVSTGLLALLDERELEAVLRHEAYHVAHHDPLRVVLANVLARAGCCFPLLAMLRDHYVVTKEFAADRHAVRALGEDGSLAAALYKLLLRPQVGDAAAAGAAVGATTCLALRVDVLLGEEVSLRHQFPLGGLVGTLVGALLLAALLLTPLSLFAGDILLHGPLNLALC